MTSPTYEVAIERTGVTIMTTNDKHRAMAASIFRSAIYGPLVMREVVGAYRRNVWTPPTTSDLAIPAMPA